MSTKVAPIQKSPSALIARSPAAQSPITQSPIKQSEAERREIEIMLLEQIRYSHRFATSLLGEATRLFNLNARETGRAYQTYDGSSIMTGINGLKAVEAAQRGALVIDRLRHGVRHSLAVTRSDAPTAAGAGKTEAS
jgi:hypothetical protein